MRRQLLLAAVLVILPAAAHAAGPVVLSGGPRVGISSSPDQFYIGGQLELGDFAPPWTVDPSLDLGFGDNETVIGLNLDGLYHLTLNNSDWTPYLGAGLGIANISIDEPPGTPDVSETQAGLNVILGVSAPTRGGSRWFSELRFGVGSDFPALKLLGGMNFRL